MVTALVAFTSATSEQIKEADHIGMKMYSWNDFLKVVGTLIVGCLQLNLLKHLDKSIQTVSFAVIFTMIIFIVN